MGRGSGRARARVALGVALVVVFSVAVVSLGVKTGRESSPPDAHISAAPAPEPDPGSLPEPMPATEPAAAPLLGDWEEPAARSMDGVTLVAAGIDVPYGANIFAARIFPGGRSPAYRFYDAGGGAFSESFYPASAVKLLAAL